MVTSQCHCNYDVTSAPSGDFYQTFSYSILLGHMKAYGWCFIVAYDAVFYIVIEYHLYLYLVAVDLMLLLQCTSIQMYNANMKHEIYIQFVTCFAS